MLKKIVLVFAALAVAKAQIPSLGWCPEYVPMTNFDLDRFLGVWHEAERYFQITELVSRCLTSNYTRSPDGKIRVYNEVTNRFTGVKRVMEGEIKPAASKSEEGKLSVKYTSVPLTPETQYSVLETDYTDYAVLWSCSGIGPFNSQSAWLMTRKRNPSGEILQKAYGVLDKYKISKRFFVKSDQDECFYEAPEPTAAAPATVSAPAPAAPVVQPSVPAVAPAQESVPVKEEPAAKKSAEGIFLRSAAVLQDGEPADESREENVEADGADNRVESKPVADEPADPAVLLPEAKPLQEVVFKSIAPETIPEVILKVAESAKETAEDPIPVAEESKTVEVAVPTESKPEPELVAAVEPLKLAEESQPEAPEAAAEEPKSDGKPAEESLPEEKPTVNVEEDKPAVEEAQPVVEAIETAEKPKEKSEEAKPLDVAPEVLNSPEPAAAVLESEIIETPAGDAEKTEKIAETEEVGKPVEVPNVAEEPAAIETAKVSEPVEQPLKNLEGAPLPETILEEISEPVVPEALEIASVEPLKTIPVPAEEPSRAEGDAEKVEATPELKP